jgi:ADP-dependent NAD(P)H-hydrate dehydratase / NAD(P)H-hydrate epimerase
MYLVSADEMREMDRLTMESFGVPGRILMENAGKGATEVFLSTFPDLSGSRIGIVAGRGNNGGDGFVIARYLAQKGLRVTLFLLADRNDVSGDAETNLYLTDLLKIPVIEIKHMDSFNAGKAEMTAQDIWIDAIFGTGLNSDVRGYFKEIIDFINHRGRPVFSVDIPSGLNADTGKAGGVCIQAHTTATFAFPKIGHILYPGAKYTGKLHVVDIGIPPHIADRVAPARYLLNAAKIKESLSPRSPEAHKGSTGHLMVVSGSTGKTGAAALTAVSAMRSGAGLVTLGIPKGLNRVAETLVLEAMTLPLPENGEGFLGESAYDEIIKQLSGKQCLAVGPGIGTEPETVRLVHRLIKNCRIPMVIDADGLNNIAGHTETLKTAGAPVVITPHPGEMARLMDTSVRQIQEDRIGAAKDFASAHAVHVVLKGARTVISHPDGTVYVNLTGNPGMASGGMGDVLTGVIAGFMTQGYTPRAAARTGVYLHGAAADTLAETMGPVGFLAGDVMNTIPGEIKKLMATGR